jgi:hypothetical protein
VNKEYVLTNIRERLDILHERYKLACNGKNSSGELLKPATAAVTRSLVRRDYGICKLIEELTCMINENRLNLSDTALEGLDKLIEPIERHTRLK